MDSPPATPRSRGQPSDLDEGIAGPAIDAFRWAYPYRLDRARIRSGSIEIEITGSFHRDWWLEHDGSGWAFVDRLDAPTHTSLSMTVEQAWRLLTNNYSAELHGPLRTSGDPELIDVLLRTRAIIGTPKFREALDGPTT